MIYHFTKMHGLGNDFVVFDAINQSLSLSAEQVRFICDRHHGVGCDQLLLVESAQSSEADFRYRIFNSDGGEVEQCGNGARCFVQFVHEKKLTSKNNIIVETNSGIIKIKREASALITVNMGEPVFEPEKIPFVADQQSSQYSIEINGEMLTVGVVSMGNPHAVLQVENIDDAPVAQLGMLLENHARFPNRANIGFMQIINEHEIRLRVYERGVGETLACGTGACAAAVIGNIWGLLNDRVKVQLAGGALDICWQGGGHGVYMTGPAKTVFDGTISL